MGIEDIRSQFPIFKPSPNGSSLAYLDNAATTQKPYCVIDRLSHFYAHEYATVHRGVYALSQAATSAYDMARCTVQAFVHAKHLSEIIFVKGTTEAINLVASSYGSLIPEGRSILISEMEHHANWVPWYQLCRKQGLHLKVIPVLDDGQLDMDAYQSLLDNTVALVAITHVSNALGTLNPIRSMIEDAHRVGAVVLVDGAQSSAHMPVDVEALGCDFYCFSGHKCYGPTGVGVLYAKKDILQKMPPYQTGGSMIKTVSLKEVTWADAPSKFEAGTPAIAEVIGLQVALLFLQEIGLDKIDQYEQSLLRYATEQLIGISELRILGQAPQKGPIVSFVMGDIHPHDIGTVLDTKGIAIRVGHHCAQPVMKRFGVSATARVSFALYNTMQEIDQLVEGLIEVRRVLG